MFPKEDIKMDHSVINEKKVEFHKALDLKLSTIKCEFDEEETKIQYGVLKNKTDETKLHAAFPENYLKTEPTNDRFSEEDVYIEYSEVKSEITEKNEEFDELTNIKCEFEEEATKIQYGVLENQLQQENVDDSSPDITKLHNGAFSGSFLKTEPAASETYFKDNVKFEFVEVKSEVNNSNKEFSASMDHELSNSKCEFEEEETKIQAGVSKNQLPNKMYLGGKRICAGEIRFKCETCGQSFSQKAHLNRHMRIHTGEKPFKCETCGKSFTQKGNLNSHMKIHAGEKPYKCQTCGECFGENGYFNEHMWRIHICNMKCEICGKCFNEKSHLTMHLKIHTGEKPYKCETCGKCFIQKSNLKSHMKIHTGEKPYKCETCGRCFTANQKLKNHMNIHTGAFKCMTCSNCFASKETLNLHMRIHTEINKCEICGECFSQNRFLNAHMRSMHKGKNPVKCETCNEFFRDVTFLNKHLKTHTDRTVTLHM